MPTIAHLQNPPQPAHRPARRHWLGLAAFSVAALVLPAWLSSCSPAASAPPTAAPRPYTFYLFDAFEATRLVPLDPATLADGPTAQALQLGRSWLLSADGSTQVNMEYATGHAPGEANWQPAAVWLIVRDRKTGAERTRFHPPVDAFLLALSADGARLVLEPNRLDYSPSVDWYLLRTADGALMSHVKDTQNACWRQAGTFDPALQRTYCLLDQAAAARPARLIAYDLASGAPAGPLELGDVLLGQYPAADGNFFEPGLALSPDGRRLAIVHADADKVTLVDAQKLAVERTVSLAPRASLLQWLAPAVAYAKDYQGTIRQAVFSADGRYLYVFTQLVADEAPRQRGLWVVDVAQGTLLAQALPQLQVQWVVPAPDGSLYAFGTTDEHLEAFEIRQSSPSSLWRLDGATLKALAHRDFTGYRGSRLVLQQP